jgi:membrane protein
MSSAASTPAAPLGAADLWPLSRDAVLAWIDDRAASMCAALAYYTLFSIAPLLLIVIAVAGAVFGADAARGEIFSQLRGLIGPDGAAAIESLLASVRHKDQASLSAFIGTGLLLIGATSVFAELQGSLDRIWRVPERPSLPGWWAVLRARLSGPPPWPAGLRRGGLAGGVDGVGLWLGPGVPRRR